MLKKLVAMLLFLAFAELHAQEITTCRSPTGKVFFHFSGLAEKASSGWSDDAISKGVFSLTQTGDGALDLLYFDSRNKPISSTQDGAVVRLLRNSKDNITILVFYELGSTEIYSFFKEKDGRHRFTMTQNRTGDGVLFPKSSVLVGDCDPIRFLIK